ncbi:MAG: polyprenyl synthetase family protein [Candidatus Aenigmarchaeota archaeon]|nr:polyprenyl synthetase family protein [Candidatus Aenigmarchaeota archaeon]MDW8149735.1 polyprenyl synthetase family protein [Candidatus Aenigmarchaeota archaeon]
MHTKIDDVFGNIIPKRSMNPDKEIVIKIFDSEFLPKFTTLLPFNKITEPLYYTIHIRSSKGLLCLFSYYLQKEFDGDLNIALLSSLSIEALSAAKLILDDIFDKDEIRSGVESTWKKYGLRKALLSIELSKNIILDKLYEVDKRIYRELKYAWENGLKGFFFEEEMYKKKNVTINDWLKLIPFFAPFGFCAVKLLKINSKIPKKLYKNIYKYNTYITIAWVFDDPLEVFSLEKSKKIYSDIRNGYYTLPIVLLLDKMNEREKTFFEKTFGKEEHVEEILALLKRKEIEKECFNIVRNYHKKAMKELKVFWNSGYNEKLKHIIRAYSYLRATKLGCDFI